MYQTSVQNVAQDKKGIKSPSGSLALLAPGLYLNIMHTLALNGKQEKLKRVKYTYLNVIL